MTAHQPISVRPGVRTSPEIRRAIQGSGESVRTLAARYGLNPKTVRRWRTRSSVEDAKSGPRTPRSTVLGQHEEALIVAVRRLTLLPLDDCFYALRGFVPGLTRASLHRCLRRHGVSRLPPRASDSARPGAFDLHMLEFGEPGGPLRLLLAVERASKFFVSRLYETPATAAIPAFLRAVASEAPVALETVHIDGQGPLAGHLADVARACAALGVAHCTHVRGWAAEQLARLDAAMGSAALSRAGEFGLAQMHARLEQFVAHFNTGCRLKALGGLTPRAYLAAVLQASEPPRRRARAAKAAARAGRGRDPEGTREAILQAARDMLARSGPQGLSLSEVARLAGVNRGTAYQHFKSRKQLIAATAEWCSEQLYEALFNGLQPRELAGGSHYDIAEVAERLASFAMENPEMCQVWLYQMLSLQDPSKDKFWNEYFGRAERFHETPMSHEAIDTEVFSVVQLSGAFLWPVWAHSKARSGEDLAPFARRYAREALRLSLFGVIRPDCYPELVARYVDPAANLPRA